MSARVRWLVFGVALVVALITQFPLRMAGLDRAGITARAAHGTIWNGSLEAAQVRGIPIGDVAVGLSPAALLGGNLRTDFAGGAINGALTRRADGSSMALAGSVGPLLLGGLSITSLGFEGVEIGFAKGRCVTATGTLQMQPAPGLSTSGTLTGAPRCDGTDVLLPLASATGDTRLDVRIGADRQYRATLAVDAANESQRVVMLAAGFEATPSGLALTVKGSF